MRILPRPVFVEEGFESSRGSLSVNGEVGQTDGLSFTRLDLRKIQFVPESNAFPTVLSRPGGTGDYRDFSTGIKKRPTFR